MSVPQNSWQIKYPHFLLTHAPIVNNDFYYRAAVVMLHVWETQGLNLTPQKLLCLNIFMTFFPFMWQY
jgi:predicted phosphoadenosine phosphosulfate sulfurtransferase